MKGIEQELDIWRQHRHPYILPLIGIYLRQGFPCAVSPWCDSGTITQYMKSARGGSEPELEGPVTNCDFDLLRLHCLEMKLLAQVAAGLAYLHAHNFAHGDIKASNILVKGGVAQLGDFGFSIIAADRSSNTSSHLGTARWFAPESLREHAHRTQEADMWALGCVILEMRTLLVPYHRVPDAAVPLAILKDRPFERPSDVHPSLWSMAEACWSRSPKTRIASPTLAGRIKITLEYATLLRETLGALPNVRSLSLGYPNSNSTARFSLASVVLKRDTDTSLDLTLAVATARNALRALEAPGKRYRPAALRPIIRLISRTDPRLAEQLTLNLPSPVILGSPLRGHPYSVHSVVFLPDSRRLVSSSIDQTVRIWDIETGDTVIGPLRGHGRNVAVHGSHIASGSYDGSFRIWDADSGALRLGPIAAHNGKGLNFIAYSRNGTRIATAGDDTRAVLWDANTGVALHEMVGHTAPVLCVAFSGDGARLVSGSQDNTLRIWDITSGNCIGEPLTGHTDSVRVVCFSPDAKRVFSASDDSTIRIWDAEMRKLIIEPLRMNSRVLCMALSPDGKRLVSGSFNGKIAMRDAETGVGILTPFNDHKAAVWGTAFSPDGRKIASTSDDKTIALWDATNDWKRYDYRRRLGGSKNDD
ncbi:WD40 repeat-like protein [Exidia glandulosa HHB12029]|uniref:Intraflagellar transport protein 122 homolog n=1 Tax=Exidia glandulosa HHB12029 TaxID=1314781 RepID=A0A165J6L2_EXIGL|nr:WD40 repeat-like protein [Exidia glandulosa HHB12029]